VSTTTYNALLYPLFLQNCEAFCDYRIKATHFGIMKFIYHSSSAPLIQYVLLGTVVSFLLKNGLVMASTEIVFGSLSNFDVFCITQNTEECHGFEIELEGIHCEDITRTFGGAYSRYGVPNTSPVTDNQGNVTSCIVEYSSSYDSDSGTFSATTIVPPQLLNGGRIGTNGHQCYLGGMNAASYDSSGCEHFGVSLRKNPTKTTYYWLVADPQNQGHLKRDQAVVGVGSVNWSALNNGGNVVVRAEVEAPEPVFECAKWGEAKWVKVNVTELEIETELDDLLSDNQVIVEAESEIEWKMLQARPTCDENGQPLVQQPENVFAVEAVASNSSKTVIRRYEFFEYTGEYEAESNEVVVLVDEDSPQDSEIGNYLGSQMAAVNLRDNFVDPLTITTAASLEPFASNGKACSYSLEGSGGAAPYTWTLLNENQNLPDGLTLGADGTIQGTVTAQPGIYEFEVQLTDSANASQSGLFRVTVQASVLKITTKKKLPKALVGKPYIKEIKVTGGTAPFTFSVFQGHLPSGLTLDAATGMIQGTATTKGKRKFKVMVKDSGGKKATRPLILLVK
jgi:hypothetical protein